VIEGLASCGNKRLQLFRALPEGPLPFTQWSNWNLRHAQKSWGNKR